MNCPDCGLLRFCFLGPLYFPQDGDLRNERLGQTEPFSSALRF